MKPFWQYWVETIVRSILFIVAMIAIILFIGWLVSVIGGLSVMLLAGFFIATFVIAFLWSVFDNDPEHMRPWFYKEEKDEQVVSFSEI